MPSTGLGVSLTVITAFDLKMAAAWAGGIAMNFASRFFRRTIAVVLLLPAILLPVLRAQPASGPTLATETERLFAPRLISGCKLSPSGNWCGMMRRFDDDHFSLLTLDLSTGKTRTMLVAKDAALIDFWWKSDDLVLVKLASRNGMVFRVFDPATGLTRELNSLHSHKNLQLFQILSSRPNEVILREAGDAYGTDAALLRIDLRADKCTRQETDLEGGVLNWVSTADGTAVAAWGFSDRTPFIQTRAKPSAPWKRQLGQPNELAEVIPLGMAPDQQHLLVLDYRQKNERGAFSALDLTTGNTAELTSSSQLEVSRLALWGADLQIAGVYYDGDPNADHFLIPEAKAADNWLDGKLPGLAHAFRSFSADGTKAIVEVWSSRNPGMYCMVDLRAQKISVLSPENPAAENLGLAGSTAFEFTARDGQVLRGWITLPSGAGPKPPMVLLTGLKIDSRRTPGVFDPAAEFFARQGFAAVRVDHRGIGGYGRSFVADANFHVHDVVINDLRDAMAHLEKTGRVDTQRAAVYGADTGGWSAFQLAAIPGLFRVLLNDCTPVELNLLHTGIFTNLGNKPVKYANEGMHSIKAKDYTESINPLNVAASLPIPSFHAYTPGHAIEKLQAAMKKNPQPHAFHVPPPFKAGGPPWVEWREEAKRFDAMAAFLKQHL